MFNLGLIVENVDQKVITMLNIGDEHIREFQDYCFSGKNSFCKTERNRYIPGD